ncbi:hypothetical protein [Dactylosporangium matsuzakiense]|uniref:Uncharacterized protein n=1 Tax=Dactylosporangium matsuzakiense TaxID=53360 RepID=A0A9W6KD36_9ACTN|nr:hypothetical protein [Dactylosporangium matsuzakiense]UWZ42243.1 hypothetical protein Dmats_32310 [Dactylosporangium matsuzakiense]GLK99896.1 hypothetical protein GCM10017581_016370 [Dactylosporangium matsuzakiense]
MDTAFGLPGDGISRLRVSPVLRTHDEQEVHLDAGGFTAVARGKINELWS